MHRLLVLATLLLTPALARGQSAPAPRPTTDFGRLVDRLSEGGGFFDSDNLVSNETSYLHVLGGFDALGVRGGAYIGVGPEQSFSYIAHIRPEIAYLIDIRRDNLLLHLLFRAMLERARNRLEYLGLLFGRPAPDDLAAWTELPLGSLLEYLDRTPVDTALHARQHRELMERVTRFGVPLTAEDRETLRRFHDEFALMGLELRFSSRGRPGRPTYPTVRQLYLETDLNGREGSYLATEDLFRVVRDLERRGRVVPVVGDLAGPSALKAIGRHLRETRRQLSVLYASNVEFYLFRQGSFARFAENVRALPAAPWGVIVRSHFGRGQPHPLNEPGHFSTQVMQTLSSFAARTGSGADTLSYWQVVTMDPVNLRATPRAPRRRRRRVVPAAPRG